MPLDYTTYEYYLSASLLVCAMFGMGATLSVREFAAVARAPQGVLLALLIQVLATPLLAIAVSRVFFLPPGIAVGLLLVAALPGGLYSNLLTFLGRGNVALSVSATAAATLGCVVTTTFVLKTFGSTQLPGDFRMPAPRILAEIAGYLLGPLQLGMMVRRWSPRRHQQVAKFFINASLVMLAVLIAGALLAGRIRPLEYGLRAPAALFLFGFLSLWTCYLLSLLLRFSVRDAFTICIEVVLRNAHLGLLLKAALFPADSDAGAMGDAVLYVLLLYGAFSLLLAGMEVAFRRNRFGVIYGWYSNRLAERSSRPKSAGSEDPPPNGEP